MNTHEPSEETISNIHILTKTVEVVAAYVGNNPVAQSGLPTLIETVHAQFSELRRTMDGDTVEHRPEPAVPISKSVTNDYIICLEDGAKLKMLKRYLRTRYDLTPEAYKARWGLGEDYPMVAPEYAQRRSAFAKEIGLGKRRD